MNTRIQNIEFDGAFIADLRRDMLRFARIQLRDDDAAEDAVQEAIAAALTGSRAFDGRSALKTWIFAILRNKIIDIFRSRKRTVSMSEIGDEEAELDETIDALFNDKDRWEASARPKAWGDPEEALRHQQFWSVFDACLNHLPENTARVFMMREFLELETPEICGELAISTSNCHVILHRARSALRRCLENNWFSGGEHA